MQYIELLTREHDARLPYVRIKRIVLENIKSVRYGEIDLLGNELIPYNSQANILGIYGQNGSGKTTLIQALSIVRGLMQGMKLGPNFANYIDKASGTGRITVEFEFQYRDGIAAVVEYSFKMERKDNRDSKHYDVQQDDDEKETIAISEECLKTNMYEETGKIGRLHTIVDTKNYPLCNPTCLKCFFGNAIDEVKDELVYFKRNSYDNARSFLFSSDLAELIHTYGYNSKYTELLTELSLYATYFLYVISNNTLVSAQRSNSIPIFLPFLGRVPIMLNSGIAIPDKIAKLLPEAVQSLDKAIGAIIPGLSLSLELIPTKDKNGNDASLGYLYSVRDGLTIPFNQESDGIRKIILVLADFVFAFNQGSTTLAIDEFDAGVYEYLLGELLQIFESDGKGQLIFTSHNLRPLEVINRKSICFTTSDPDNRYCRIKNVGKSNNLRDLYLKTVQMNNSEVELYKRTKAFKIVNALKESGKTFVKEED